MRVTITVRHLEKKRKYYHITEKGKAYLAEKSKEWEQYSSAINSILFVEKGAAI